MIRRILPVFVLALASCGDTLPIERPYEWNDLRLVTSYTAKAVCSCLFVEERTMDECIAYGKQSPAVASWGADLDGKSVDASALLLWGARAHWVDEKFGCVLE